MFNVAINNHQNWSKFCYPASSVAIDGDRWRCHAASGWNWQTPARSWTTRKRRNSTLTLFMKDEFLAVENIRLEMLMRVVVINKKF